MIAGTHVVMWVAIDPPGNDTCRFDPKNGALLIEGSAWNDAGTTRYRVRATRHMIFRRLRLEGARRHLIERSPKGIWTMDGAEVPAVAGLKDVDLGITPATKTVIVRRLALAVDAKADLAVAWFDPGDATLKPLRQLWHRTGERTYHYAAPDHAFTADLTVDAFGAVTAFPPNWQAQI